MSTHYDVIIIGAGAAGLSAATVLGRSRRSVLVVDAGEPRNAPADGVHNFLSRDGIGPLELARLGRAEAAGYGVTFVDGAAAAAQHAPDGDGGFLVTLADGRAYAARRLLVATGVVDELPDVDGLAERWGRDVVHCPYCHGWEVRDQRIAVLATSAMAGHGAGLFRQLSDDVTILQHTAPELSAEERDGFDARGVRIVPGKVERVVVEDDRIVGVDLEDGTRVACDVIAVQTVLHPRAEFLRPLGIEPEPMEMHGVLLGSRIPAEQPGGATSVPGVHVAGNVTEIMSQVVAAASAGMMTGAMINGELVAEDTKLALAAQA